MFDRDFFQQARRILALLPALIACDLRGAALDDEQLLDPTRPLTFMQGDDGADDGEGFGFGLGLFDALTSYELSSVLIRSTDRIAVINAQRVRVGDRVGSAVVMAIEADHVRLNVDGEIQTLELYANSIKTLVKGDE